MRFARTRPWKERAALVVLATALLARTGYAQQPDRKIEAEALFEQAKTLSAQGNYARACPLFAESQRLDPGLGTMLWLADCFESNGQTASAWAQFKEAAGAAALRKDPREKVAREHAAQLEPRLAKLVVRPPASPIAGLEVRRDGAILTQAEMGLELPVDPGPHSIEAHAPGHKAWSTTVAVPRAAEVVGVDVPALEASPASGVASVPETPVVSAETKAPPGRLRLTGLLVGGAGAVVLGVATALSVDAKLTYDSSNQNGHCHPDNACDQQGLNDRSTAQGLAAAATAGFVVGAAALVGGGILYFVAPRTSSGSPAPAVAVSVSPTLGLGQRGGAIGVSGAW
jgi:hypothetical protein